VIKHTGMFDNVDRLYGDFDMALKGFCQWRWRWRWRCTGGASFGGGGIGGEDLDFSDEEPTEGEASLEGGEIPAEGGEAPDETNW
jgi:hypothetical protein